MVEMDTRQHLLEHLKRHGPSLLDDLSTALQLSENAIRHHLDALKHQGFLEISLQQTGVGRPAKRYALSAAAENLFPKQYQELLELILCELKDRGILEGVVAGITERLNVQLQAKQPNEQPLSDAARVTQLVERLDFGGILSQLETTDAGWELQAFNCRYRDTGFQYEVICNILPAVIERATGLQAHRPTCQRDGARACHFAIHR